MNLRFIFAFILAFFLLPFVFSWTDNGAVLQNVDGCGTLSTENTTYVLTGNVSATNTCFTVGANNVTLDCNGYKITYGNSGTGYGFYSDGFNESNIKHCEIVEGTSTASSKFSIYLRYSHNISVENVAIYTNRYAGYGVYLYLSENFTFLNSSISTSGSQGYGIYNHYSENVTISENNISTLGSNAYGIYNHYSENVTISENNISTSGSSGHGIYFSISEKSLLKNNFVSVMGDDSRGIYIHSSIYLTFLGNKMTSPNSISYFFTSSNSEIYYNHTLGEDNLANGKPIHYVSGESNLTYDNHDFSQYGQILFTGLNNLTISNSYIENKSLEIYHVDGFNLINNTIKTYKKGRGVYLSYSENSMIKENNLSLFNEDSDGIYLSNSNFFNITSNEIKTFLSDSKGIYSYGSDYVDISDNIVLTEGNYSAGIYQYNCDNLNITNNSIETKGHNSGGISLQSISQSIFSNNTINTIYANPFYFSFYGSFIDNVVGEDNLANGKPIHYVSGESNLTYDNHDFSQYGLILFAYTDNLTISNSNMGGNSLFLMNSNYFTLDNNTNISNMYDYQDALFLSNSHSATIKNNIISNILETDGINLDNSDNATIIENKIDSVGIAVDGSNSENVIISWNNITSGGDGISVPGQYSLISNNYINSSLRGIESSSYYSEIFNNTIYAGDDGVYFFSALYLNFTYNKINASSEGLNLRYSDHSIISFNEIYSDDDVGMESYDSENVTLHGNEITTDDSYEDAIYSYRGFFSNFSKNTLFSNNGEALYYNYPLNPNLTIEDSVFTAKLFNYPLRISGNSNFQNIIISDTTFNSLREESMYVSSDLSNAEINYFNVTNNYGEIPKILFSSSSYFPKEINVYWWLETYINGTDSSPFSGINLSVEDAFGQQNISYVTDFNGTIGKQPLLEYTETEDSKTYYSNYSLNAYLNEEIGYTETKSFNLTGNTLLTFTKDVSAPEVDFVSPQNETHFSNEEGIEISANISDEGRGIKNATINIYDELGDLYNSSTQEYEEDIQSSILEVIFDFFEGVFKWNYKLFDWDGNSKTSENYTLEVDLTYPKPRFNENSPLDNAVFSNSFTVNISIDEKNLDSVTWVFNGELISFNDSYENLTNFGEGNWNFIYTQSGLETGESYQYYLLVSDIAGNINSTETRNVVGNTPPETIFISTDPSDFNFIDPSEEIQVIANISDIDSNFDYSILQWKEEGGEWENVSMQNITLKAETTLTNASFILPPEEVNITLRIISFDTEGGIDYSEEKIVESKWDCTWEVTPSLGSIAGWDENKRIGRLYINNTGDENYFSGCVLDFSLTYNLAKGRIYFDEHFYKDSQRIGIAPKESLPVEVNATFSGEEIMEEKLEIEITELSDLTPNSTQITKATLISNKEGPYFLQEIDSYSNPVFLTPSTFNLGGYLSNVMGSTTENENNTAYNVTFSWINPSGFSLVSGELTKSFGNISNNGLIYNNIELGFSDLNSMSPGIKTFSLFSKGYTSDGSLMEDSDGNSNLTDSVQITFLCYNESDSVCVEECGYTQDPDCSIPSSEVISERSTGGGGGGKSSQSLFDKSEASFELLNGEQKEFILPIENKYGYSKVNLEVTITGENSEYVIPTQKTIKKINPNSTYDLNVKISAPAYFSKGKYLLKFKFRGYLSEGGVDKGTPYSEEKYVTLYIVERTREQADNYLKEAEDLVNILENESLISKGAKKHFDGMNAGYEQVDFLIVEEEFNNLKTIYSSAIDSKDLLGKLNSKVEWAEKYGMDVFETKKLYLLAETIYNRGDYVLARQKLDEALSMYSYETKGEIKLWYLIKNNPFEALGIFLGSILLFSIVYYFSKRTYFKNKIYSLTKEESLLLGLMKGIQNKCFNEGKMSMTEYYNSLDEYQRQLALSVKKRIKYESKLNNFFTLSGKTKTLNHERNRLIELIKDLQTRYMAKGELDSRIYENLIKSYSKHLGDIEEEISFIEIKNFLKKEKFRRRK